MTFTVEHPAQVPVFIIAWLLIVKERWDFCPIGRTAGAMIMGVMTVVVQTLGPEEAFEAIEYGTLALLWGMMVLVEYLKDDALFDMFVNSVFVKNKNLTPTRLLWLVSISCGALSALFTNDTMCIALTKTICYVCTQKGFHPGPQMVAIAMSANIGSGATLIGNPQNAIIASISGVPFAKFLAFSVVAAAVCVIINTFALSLWYRDDLQENTAFAAAAKEKMVESGMYGATEGSDESTALLADSSDLDGTSTDEGEGNTICCCGPFTMDTQRGIFRKLLIFTIVGTLAGFLADLDIGWCAAAGGLAAMFLDAVINHKVPDRIFARVNWELLVFFSGLFIVIEGLQHTMIPGQLLDEVEDLMNVESIAGVCAFTAIITVGCNIFNNVPLVLLVGLASSYDDGEGVEKQFMETIGDPELAWILLAWVATVAGNLTLMGSVANLIVAEEGKNYFEMSFGYYSKFGFPITIVTLYVGVAIICGMWTLVHA
uniref:Low silicon 2-like protein n=1 Tax=Acanthoeca spectabilis TaxID=81533 RepID=A0A1D8RAE8_9EUKA|nr:low silicon 2-like protein [Acanthoeca spectabilis]|eukprot:m.205295 g.205295  ORF g.205295 m.205295 type:complete len:486 (+) comp15404_c0_seq3:72-1529(+)